MSSRFLYWKVPVYRAINGRDTQFHTKPYQQSKKICFYPCDRSKWIAGCLATSASLIAGFITTFYPRSDARKLGGGSYK